MTRPRTMPQESIELAISNLSRTRVILAGVSAYDELEDLDGPSFDMDMMCDIFFEDDEISLYDSSQVTELPNPTSAEFRQAIIEYAHGRSARGDILILYFTGHVCIIGGGTFGFCLRDTKIGPEGKGILPLSVVPINDVLQTLNLFDVHPVLIIDACFSSVTAPHGLPNIPSTVEDVLKLLKAGTYALLASSSSVSESIDTIDGGVFTQALHTIAKNGLPGDRGRFSPFITIDVLADPLESELATQGAPLSRCHIVRDFPILPIAKNTTFQPQTERFGPTMKKIVELLWNVGSPREAFISEFSSEISQGAYANHSKLSYPPWNLLEDAGDNSIRRLTKRGKLFAEGKLSITRMIVRDTFTWEWIRSPGTDDVYISDIA